VFKRAAATVLALAVAATVFAAEPPVRDPTQPFDRTVGGGASARAAAPRFAVTAVLISPTRQVAIVNGTPYVVGETVDGAEIVAIVHNAVHLRESGVELVVSLGRPSGGR
jgi:hypothetical protein